MILGRDEILKQVNEKKLIENFEEGCLEGAGYDLRVKTFFLPVGDAYLRKSGRKLPKIKEIPENEILLKSNDYVLMETVEKVNMPENLVARVLNKSSLFRCGASTFNALVDPGFHGTLTFGLRNISNHEISIKKGVKIAQIVFEEVRGKTELYDGKYQGGKVV